MATETQTQIRRAFRIGTLDTGHTRRAIVKVEATIENGRLSITADAKRPGAYDIDEGGQMYDALLSENFTPDSGWTAERVRELVTIWQRWHLNDMRATCEHQRALGWDRVASDPVTLYHWRLSKEAMKAAHDAMRSAEQALKRGETVTLAPDVLAIVQMPTLVTTANDQPPAPLYVPNGPQYENDHYNRASETKTRNWTRASEHPDGLLGKPCPVCGYGYGTAWKSEDLPAEIVAYVAAL